MEKIYTLKPYLIEAVYGWCQDNDYGTYIEVIENNNKKLFDISSNYVANLFFEEEGISFITVLNKEEQKIFIGYENIMKVFSKIGSQGLDFSTMQNKDKKGHLVLIVNNLQNVNNTKHFPDDKGNNLDK